MTRASSNRLLRIPVRFVEGHWETQLGGPIPATDGAGAVLTLDRRSISDNEFLKAMDLRGRHKVLGQGTRLLISLSVKPDGSPSKELRRLLIPHDDPLVKGRVHFAENWTSVLPSFAEVNLGDPDAKQAHSYDTEWGGLWLVTHGLEAVGLGSTTIHLPQGISADPVTSLNHAYTKLSEAFEPWRISHTGNVYTRVFYEERNEKWYPLNSLRNQKLAEKEQEIARGLWAAFLAKMAPKRGAPS
jgi:hypothetical protein